MEDLCTPAVSITFIAGAQCANFVARGVMFVFGHLTRKKLTGRNSDSFVFIIGWGLLTREDLRLQCRYLS